MNIKVLQLNIEKGSHLDTVTTYIKRNNFDIVMLQEVTGGSFSHAGKNCFESILKKTVYQGELGIYIGAVGDISSFCGNATLFLPPWKMISSHIIWLKRYQEYRVIPPEWIKVPRCALVVLLEKNGKKIMVVNTHLAWGPTSDDALYKRNQAEKLYLWMKAHTSIPFILAGDFNLNPHTVIVSRLSQLGNNLIKKYKVTNTLNPRTHRAKDLFPSGLPVDYIITDHRIRINNFFVEESVDLSDHLGLVLECAL